MRTHSYPGRWVYLVAALIALGGLAVSGAMFYHAVSIVTHGFEPFEVPGETTVTFARPGTYTIYHEHRSVIGSRVYVMDEPVSGLECEVVEKASGRKIPIRTSKAESTYQVGSREGRALFTVRIDRSGVYSVRARYAPGFEGPATVLTVGTGSIVRFVAMIVGGLALMLACSVASLALVLYTYVARRSALAVVTPDKI